MCSAVRQAMACNVSVGLRAPLVPITEPPATARLGTSWDIPHSSRTCLWVYFDPIGVRIYPLANEHNKLTSQNTNTVQGGIIYFL